ncbi:hypothetical protein [Orrella marina]|uniref:hypothetical protein n=1 Tax=Orrella marina TaxID=2163011 RepID=UPI001D13242B|nr:hypothetical protein [Orrella marina]
MINTVDQMLGEPSGSHHLPRSVNWIVRTSLDPRQVNSRIAPKIRIDPGSDDFGMVMHDALTLDLSGSLARYAHAHQDWAAKVDLLADHLTSLKIDAVLADVPYLTLAAAHQAGIRTVALCSLNWADILQACVAKAPAAGDSLRKAGLSWQGFEQILDQMREAYNHASRFLQPEPGMAMPSLTNGLAVGPVCEIPRPCPRASLEALARLHGHDGTGWFVLVSMGGIPTRLSPERWPESCLGKPVYYLVTSGLAARHPQALAIDDASMQSMGLTFANLFAGCDLVISKPGYGTFVESACSGTPLLFLPRPDWPESPALVDWILQHGRAAPLMLDQLGTHQIEAAMASLLEQGRFDALQPTGNRQAAEYLLKVLTEERVSGVGQDATDHQSDNCN